MSRLSCVLLLSLLLPVLARSQNIRVPFHELSTENGLSQGSNAFIYHDRAGFVWISSIDGLNRFDGKSVRTYRKSDSYRLLDNIITSRCFEDQRENLWFTTYEGLHRLDRETEKFTPLQLPTGATDTARQDYYAFHLDESEQLWVRTGLGKAGRLHFFHTKTGLSEEVGELDGNRIFVFEQDERNERQLVSCLFVGKSGIGLSTVTDSIRTQYYFTKSDELPALKSYAAHREADGLLWLAMEDGLVAFSPTNEEAKYFQTFKGQATGDAIAIERLDEDRLIVATRNAGLLIFSLSRSDYVQELPYSPDEPNGLQLPLVNDIYLDAQQNLWLSSPRQGINFGSFLKNKFGRPAALKALATKVVFQSNSGDVWTNGPSGQAYRFTPDGRLIEKKLFNSSSKTSPTPKDVEAFFDGPGASIWAVSGMNLFRLDAGGKNFQHHASLSTPYLSHLILRDSTYLLATYGGIFQLVQEEDNIELLPFTAIGNFQRRQATAMFLSSKGELQLALDAKELVTFAPKNGNEYVETSTLSGVGYVYSVHEKNDTLWLATTNGMLIKAPKSPKASPLNSAKGAILNETLYCAIEDKNGSIWLAGNRGILRYFPQDQNQHRFTTTDGIQGLEYNRSACLITTEGWIWMGGNNGANVFRPESIGSSLPLPKISFSQIMINDELDTSLPPSEILETVELPYENNTISVTVQALEYSDPLNNLFRYRLQPSEDDWVEAGQNGFIRYPNLAPGNYVLQVLAANSDGDWAEQPRELKMHIQTPWWLSIWFFLACLLAIALIIYTIFNYRLQQALKVERIRVRISSDLHDDVGSILTGLAMQAEIVELTADSDNKAQLNKISTLSRSAMARMRDTVWAIDARKDKLQDLIFRIQEHAQEVLAPKGIDFVIKVDPLLNLRREMTSDIRQNLYLISKECLTNTAKHSNGNEAFIDLKKDNKGLSLIIRDNGQVSKAKTPSSGLGLSNIELRTKQIGATYQIDSQNGFCVTIKLPNY